MLAATERGDIDAFASMLAEEATFTMPPLASWFEGRDAIVRWAAQEPLSGRYRWRILPARANGQLALAYYSPDQDGQRFAPFALNVLTFRGGEIANVTAFIARSSEPPPNGPNPAFDINVEQARESIRKLAALDPSSAWAGHADPVTGDVRSQLERAASAPVP